MTLVVTYVEGTELHLQYPREHKPQPCYLALDLDAARLYAEANPIVGSGVPAKVFEGRELRYAIPPLRASAANALLSDAFPFAERILAGQTEEWTGQRFVTKFSPDADEANEELCKLCDGANENVNDALDVWTAEEWYEPLGSDETIAREVGLKPFMDEEEIALLAEHETEDAEESDHVDRLDGAGSFLLAVAGRLRKALLERIAELAVLAEDTWKAETFEPGEASGQAGRVAHQRALTFWGDALRHLRVGAPEKALLALDFARTASAAYGIRQYEPEAMRLIEEALL